MYKSKKLFIGVVKTLFCLVLVSGLFFACKKEEAPSPNAMDGDTSYAFGMLMAGYLTGEMGVYGLIFDYKAFSEGFKDYYEGSETRLTPNEVMEKIQTALMQRSVQDDETRWLSGEQNLRDGEEYMRTNGERSEVSTTESGLQYELISQGRGRSPGASNTVRVHYEGTFIDGTVFDSSFQRGTPIEFPLDGVIAGWTEGLQLMNIGSSYRFVIPPYLAYGSGGYGSIPPNATLIFRVELLEILD